MNISALIEGAAQVKASDIHLMEECAPYFRLDGELTPVKHPPLTHEDMLVVVNELVPERLREVLEKRRGVDLGFKHKDVVRLRLIVYYERQRIRMVFRLIPLTIPTLEQLNLPPVVQTIATFNRGMVLVTGPTGSGKSTTLSAVIHYINSHDRVSITTIEDPIEFVHTNMMGMVTQREVGEDVLDFNSGVIQALRQDPDVILVGEMRDTDTIRTAIKASETGHYVLSTLHTTNAIQTMERVIGTFPQAEQDLVREQLASNLRASITQTLVRRAEGKGRAAALEVLVVTGTVSKLISENRLRDIYGVMQGGEEGMMTCDQALAKLVREKIIAEEEGLQYARDEFAYKRYIKGVSSSNDRGGIIAGFGG
ncbi:MAG: PilT/PilU family type 4a pilus ATPase [Candidatus Sumerlaeaceae bacterium]|nr:PilT/PilU family type 4a pilus ATPase [Candidatus Sumerlaeaceae bacterium]